MRLIWLLIGWVSLGVGAIGLILPVMPTVPFVLLAAFCFARGSKTVYNWLIHNKTFGPMIKDWQERGAISRKTKWITTISLIAAVFLAIAIGAPTLVIIIEALIFLAILIFVWSRPD